MSTNAQPSIVETLSVNEFKTKFNADSLQVVKNPHTGKLFVSANGKTLAAVSKNYEPDKAKEFINMEIGQGEYLWCLHNQNESNVVESL